MMKEREGIRLFAKVGTSLEMFASEIQGQRQASKTKLDLRNKAATSDERKDRMREMRKSPLIVTKKHDFKL